MTASERPWLKHYPDHVPADLQVGGETALEDFKKTAHRFPDKASVCYFDHAITYGDIDRFSDNLAAALLDFGLKKKDRIILVFQNIPQVLIATYAAWKLGAIVVPLNPMFREKELLYYCQDSGAKFFFISDEIASELDLSFLRECPVEKIICTSPLDFFPGQNSLPNLLKQISKAVIPGTTDLLDLLEKYHDKTVEPCKLSPDDVAYLTYTSGTTGVPKGAMNTQGNIAFNARVYQLMQSLDERDLVLGMAPLFHVTGEVAHLATAALVGIPVILYYRFDAGETLRLIEYWQATVTVAAITAYIALLNHPEVDSEKISSLVKAYSGGAPVSEALVQQFETKTGLYIHNCYGMTETSSPSHIVPWGKSAPVDPESGALSVGLPVPNGVMQIVDLENGIGPLPPGEIGEIVDSGPMIVPGYWNKPEESRNAIRDGWLFTGDVGKMNSEGWFFVVDRKKDLIIASGYKIWPRDVEDVIYQHPAVKEVAVIGIPDAYRGETVKAFVALKEGQEAKIQADELIDFCRKRMAAYKYPRELTIVSEIPKTATGKFLRRALK
ncbi:MAG: AMP-binding protein [SAR324 cluster bacterium]|nr:AMP-binding protein [SAR324 cluster bacterium]